MTDLPSLPASPRKIIAIGLLFNLALLALAYYLLIGWPGSRPAPAPSDIGGHFEMRDQQGRSVSDATQKGRPYAIFFGFTHCPDVCPTTLGQLARLRHKLGTDGTRFDILFVSVDPERDRPDIVSAYVALFDTPIRALSGSKDQFSTIVRAFRVYYRKVPTEGGDYTIDHTATVFLMDGEGRFMSTLAPGESDDMALAKLRRLIDG